MELEKEFMDKVCTALLERRKEFATSDSQFAKQQGIDVTVFNRLKKGGRIGLLANQKWLSLARELGVCENKINWHTAKTDVFDCIKEDIEFCKMYSASLLFVDQCGIGKTYTAKYLSPAFPGAKEGKLKNCFYVDASQTRTETQLIRTLGKVTGIGDRGKISEIKNDTITYLSSIDKPVIIIDEAGSLDYKAFMLLKEFWNSTEGFCGWYVMGADGLRSKLERGIKSKTPGYAELFSRLSEKFGSIVPIGGSDKVDFYKRLITQVMEANGVEKAKMGGIVRKCITINDTGYIGGLRRAKSLLILENM